MTFEEYVVSWFHDFVEQHKCDDDWCNDLFTQLGYNTADYLDPGEKPYDFLMALDDENEIYEGLFGYSARGKYVDDLPDTEGFLTRMFLEVGKNYIKEYDFAKELLEDMAENCIGYTNPIDFFEDLQCGGCGSGMVGMFIYNTDCREFYIDHIDSMEDFVEELEDEFGFSIKNEQRLPHYTFVC